jgi:hypothetical protein
MKPRHGPTEGKNVEKVMRNPKDRSMRKIKLVLPYTRISDPDAKTNAKAYK